MIARLGPLAALLLILVVSGPQAVAQRPPASKLFPEETVAYLRIEDASELREAFRESSLGKIARDPQMQPLLGELYGGVAEMVGEFQEQLGASLDDLLAIPQGEIAFAVVPISDADRDAERDAEQFAPDDESPEAIRARIEQRRRQRRSRFGFVGLIDAREQIPVLMEVVASGERRMIADGWEKTRETVGEVDTVALRRGRREIAFAERAGVLLVASRRAVLAETLRRWDGEASGRSLSTNVDFSTSLSQCLGAEDGMPQLTFYLAPAGLLEQIPNPIVYPILEELGITGIRGIAGSQLIGGETYESVMHLHVALESPREGLLAVIRPGDGPLTPEPWVPEDVESYIMLNWRIPQTFDAVGRIVGRFAGPDAWQQFTENASNRIGTDLREDLLGRLTGRLSLLTWYETPPRLNSRVRLLAIETEDAEAARRTVETVLDRLVPEHQVDRFGSARLYRLRSPRAAGEGAGMLRTPEPHVVLLGDYVFLTDSRAFVERVVRTGGDADAPKLGDLAEYDLVLGEAGIHVGDRTPFLTSFQRPEKSFRFLYDLARSADSREALRRMAETNGMAAVLHRALQNHELPPFGVITQHLAPAGGVAYDTSTGLHFVSFSLHP